VPKIILKNPHLWRILSVVSGIILYTALSASVFAGPKTPYTDGSKHEGVMGCYNSTCHSRQEATGVIVRQNEVLTWQDETSASGAHVRAYKTLKGKRSKTITQRLGLGNAWEEESCLGCHTDNIPVALRGETFHIEDGIGCESCHGGSKNWLTQHYAVGASHETNVALGLYPLENAETSAKVCLSCHLGSEADNQFVTHRFMAAGHPRMSFELDLFIALQSHHDEDVDYTRRKSVQTGAQRWAIGQAQALKTQLTLFKNPELNKDGLFPELVFFDCLACHRPISDDPDWRPSARPNPGRPQDPGLVKFNDANMLMLLGTALQIAPDIAPQLSVQIKNFHASLSGGAVTQDDANAALIKTAYILMDRISQTDFTAQQTLAILDNIVTETLSKRYTDYVAAEQAIMAIDTLLSSMIAAKQVTPTEIKGMRAQINIGYDAVEDPNTYQQDTLTNALKVIQTRLRSLQ